MCIANQLLWQKSSPYLWHFYGYQTMPMLVWKARHNHMCIQKVRWSQESKISADGGIMWLPGHTNMISSPIRCSSQNFLYLLMVSYKPKKFQSRHFKLVYLNCAPMSNHFCLPYKLPTHTEEGTQPNGIFVWKAHTWPVGVNWATNISTEVQNPLVHTNITSFGRGSSTPEGFNWWKFHEGCEGERSTM
jgi:hypothetical protein